MQHRLLSNRRSPCCFRASLAVALTLVVPAFAQPVPTPRPPELRPAPAQSAPQSTPEAANICAAALASGRLLGHEAPPVATDNPACQTPPMLSLSAIKLADGSSVDVEPAVTVRCDFAMALADWTRDEIAPALAAMGKLTKLTGAGGYECRTRNRVPGAKMSEHATGNAFDVHGFVFANGKRMSVIDLRANLETLASMRAATCQRFMTVLGPGADSAHADHLHVDLEFRRGGRHLCQWPDTAPTPAESVTR